jgi:uncharacterized protein (TIGR02996 family)
MPQELKAFLRAIEERPMDVAVYNAFSDWLDEHGEHEEAALYRGWTVEKLEARRYLKNFAQTVNRYEDGHFDHEWAIRVGRKALADGGYCFGTTEGSDFFYNDDDRTEFWKYWSIATGNEVSKERAESIYFRCAC